ncbi:hypothetical protein GCM10022223_24210 [Kineosporia mesophila]|uniref:Uncharacterized protein n=1 Tax=Kineosporia mesophila TaxID=566012 RepID=A0ABP6ZFZ5_9ACTN|nr:hypothetical protein [Kineosporia mesophila]MCD5350690.1 hypothetical protein [Kineosporia mesophila]
MIRVALVGVALVGDQPLVRPGPATSIATEDDLEPAGKAGDSREGCEGREGR